MNKVRLINYSFTFLLILNIVSCLNMDEFDSLGNTSRNNQTRKLKIKDLRKKFSHKDFRKHFLTSENIFGSTDMVKTKISAQIKELEDIVNSLDSKNMDPSSSNSIKNGLKKIISAGEKVEFSSMVEYPLTIHPIGHGQIYSVDTLAMIQEGLSKQNPIVNYTNFSEYEDAFKKEKKAKIEFHEAMENEAPKLKFKTFKGASFVDVRKFSNGEWALFYYVSSGISYSFIEYALLDQDPLKQYPELDDDPAHKNALEDLKKKYRKMKKKNQERLDASLRIFADLKDHSNLNEWNYIHGFDHDEINNKANKQISHFKKRLDEYQKAVRDLVEFIDNNNLV